MTTPRNDTSSTPWRVKEVRHTYPFTRQETVRHIVYNRYGDAVASCWWGPDAERIVAAVNRDGDR